MRDLQQIERDLLGMAILKHDCRIKLLDAEIEAFTGKNREIADAIIDMYNSGLGIDLPSLSIKLKEQGSKISEKYLMDLYSSYTVENFDFLLKKLHDNLYKTRLADLAKDLYTSVKKGLDPERFAEEILSAVEKISRPPERDFFTIGDDCSLDDIFKQSSYFKTGLKPLDDHIVGIFKGQLFTIGGRPGTGKTTLALTIARNVAMHSGRVLYFSLEMNRDELYSKMLSAVASVESWKIEIDKLTDDERGRVVKAHDYIQKNVKMVVFDGHLPWNKIRNYVKKFADSSVMVVADYLQLIPGGTGKNQHERVGSISTGCKQLARQFNIPVILLSQLTRDSEREGRRPRMSDLRESGSIEADSDVVLFPYEDSEGNSELIVGKARKAKTGSIMGVKFTKEYSRFDEYFPSFDDTKNIYK